MNQNMNQKAEKIYNIEHAEHIHIDASGLFEAIKDSPELSVLRPLVQGLCHIRHALATRRFKQS